MNLAATLQTMFPLCRSNGSLAELTHYATPQNCEVIATGVKIRNIQAGRKSEQFLVNYNGTFMFIEVTDKYPEADVTSAHACIIRMEDASLPRDKLETWAREQIEHNCCVRPLGRLCANRRNHTRIAS